MEYRCEEAEARLLKKRASPEQINQNRRGEWCCCLSRRHEVRCSLKRSGNAAVFLSERQFIFTLYIILPLVCDRCRSDWWIRWELTPDFEVVFMVLEFFLYSFAILFRNNSALLWFLTLACLLYSPKNSLFVQTCLNEMIKLHQLQLPALASSSSSFFLHKHDSYPLIYVPYRFPVLFCFVLSSCLQLPLLLQKISKKILYTSCLEPTADTLR